MGRFLFYMLVVWSMPIGAKGISYSLAPAYNEANQVEFTVVKTEGGDTLKGVLIGTNGKRYDIPDVCEPEGGNAELADAYVVKGKDTYFLFTCAWPVQHSGVGLNGIQYETFVYVGKDLSRIEKKILFSQLLSGYEGSLEEGQHSYAWYTLREIASKKLLELEAGSSIDSLSLVHTLILVRLKSRDYKPIKSYLDPDRIKQLLVGYPISKKTVVAYNDIGYALGEAGKNELAYWVLKQVEAVAPSRVVVKLNIADALWTTDRKAAKKYYKEYIDLMQKDGKKKLIPVVVFERVNNDTQRKDSF